jgi:hypothetical protein
MIRWPKQTAMDDMQAQKKKTKRWKNKKSKNEPKKVAFVIITSP